MNRDLAMAVALALRNDAIDRAECVYIETGRYSGAKRKAAVRYDQSVTEAWENFDLATEHLGKGDDA